MQQSKNSDREPAADGRSQTAAVPKLAQARGSLFSWLCAAEVLVVQEGTAHRGDEGAACQGAAPEAAGAEVWRALRLEKLLAPTSTAVQLPLYLQ